VTRWLVTGAGGMVGRDLCDVLAGRGEESVALAKADLDVTDARAVEQAVRDARPAVIVNCAAYTKVDAAEKNADVANAVNGAAVEFLADSANAVDALLVQISSDYVFDGKAREPYEVDAPTGPISAYGHSKLMGEQAATHARKFLVVRTSWLFGVHGNNFVRFVSSGINPVPVITDQRGRPTYTPHLAEAIVRLARNGATGIVHYADAPEGTWLDFAKEIVAQAGLPVDLKPIDAADLNRPAARPKYSVLSTERYERLTGVAPESWIDGLRDYLSRSK
jgi:dTDP-4-dehydrorhamnose reductase